MEENDLNTAGSNVDVYVLRDSKWFNCSYSEIDILHPVFSITQCDVLLSVLYPIYV